MSALWLGLQTKYWGLAWGPITETFHHTSSSHPGKTHVRPRSVAMVSVRDLGGVGRAQEGGGVSAMSQSATAPQPPDHEMAVMRHRHTGHLRFVPLQDRHQLPCEGFGCEHTVPRSAKGI